MEYFQVFRKFLRIKTELRILTLFTYYLNNCQIVFKSSCSIFLLPPAAYWFPVSPHLGQCLLLYTFLIIAILECVKWYLISYFGFDLFFSEDCSWVSFHVFIGYSPALSPFFLKKCLFRFLVYFKKLIPIGLFFFNWVVNVLCM